MTTIPQTVGTQVHVNLRVRRVNLDLTVRRTGVQECQIFVRDTDRRLSTLTGSTDEMQRQFDKLSL